MVRALALEREAIHPLLRQGYHLCAVALKNIEIIERERLAENTGKMGGLYAALMTSFAATYVREVRGGKGLLAAVEFVEERTTKRNMAIDRRVAARMQAEMMKRGVVTRTRPVAGPHPAPGDEVLLALPLVLTETEVDRMVGVLCESVKVILGVQLMGAALRCATFSNEAEPQPKFRAIN